MQNGIFKLDLASVADAVLTAAVLAIVGAFYGVVTVQGFDVFAADWGSIGRSMVNIGFVTTVISLAKDLISTTSGSVLGLTPATVLPPQQ